MKYLDQIISSDLNSQVPLIKEIGEYLILAGGKRIRPLMVILIGKMLGINQETIAFKNESYTLLYKMAAMIEYIHTATLLHDDVVDQSKMRRGRKTANAIFGNAPSVLVGDFIYTRAFQMMASSGSLRLLQVMAKATNTISEGEIMQLTNIAKIDLSWDEYFKVIHSKTATLFEAGAQVAGIVAQVSPAIEQQLIIYAQALGVSFQIVDDILDYAGDSANTGKAVGNDLLEGKITLPLIYLIQNSDAAIVSQIKQTIADPQQKNINSIIDLVKSSGALNYCKNLAAQFVTDGLTALTNLPQNEHNQALADLLSASLHRVS